ncbi:MAG: hypothetical protein K2X66_17890, partial [Cyanobacteria bacterium]|nr:hypothetical protein [Cyanobacteriota bacterium]
MISLPLHRSEAPKRGINTSHFGGTQNRNSHIQISLTRSSGSDVFFGAARKGTKGAKGTDDPAVLAAMLKMAKKMDGTNPFTPISITNRIYQETFPRELGIIVYGSSRTQEGTPEYLYDVAVGKALGSIEKNGKKMHVVTGGGPGAMRAVAEGATNVGAHAVGSAMNFIGETPSTDVHPEFVVHPNFAERIDAPGGYEHRGAYTAAVPGGPGT